MTRKLLALLMILPVALILMSACEGEQGPPGEDASAVCTNCHNDDTLIWAIVAQYGNSVHFNGGNYERNTPPCSRCHTSEGFIAYWETGDPGTPENPSAIGCFTCHRPHTNYNFDRRYTAPVVLDEGGGTFDKGDANLCAMCHQPRVAEPAIPASGTVIITSSRWGPHHGPQSALLSGLGTYEFAGENYTRNHAHYTSASSEGCPTCHMAAPFGSQAGGHTWNLTYDFHGVEEDLVAGCETVGCHSSIDDFHYHDVQDTVVAKIDELRTLLFNAGIINASDQAVVPETLTVDEAGALYNFQFFREDRSNGVHNPALTLDALDASIAIMGGR